MHWQRTLLPLVGTGCKTIPESVLHWKEVKWINVLVRCAHRGSCALHLNVYIACTLWKSRVDECRVVAGIILKISENFSRLQRPVFLKPLVCIKIQYRDSRSVHCWTETAIVLDLPSRPTSLNFNNAPSMIPMCTYLGLQCAFSRFLRFAKSIPLQRYTWASLNMNMRWI